MDEQLYPKLNDGGMLNFMEDKVKQVQKDLAQYKKIKSKWSVANTVPMGHPPSSFNLSKVKANLSKVKL